jgi:O-antigen/teichoic acid export membrane protein
VSEAPRQATSAAAAGVDTQGGWPAIFRNVGLLTAGKIIGDGFTFLLFVALSRAFGAEGIGRYSLAMALTGFVLVLAEFGLNALAVKQLSRHPDSFRDWFGAVLALRLLLAGGGLLLLAGIVPWLPFEYETRLVIALIGVYHALLPLVDGFAGAFVARERMVPAVVLQLSLRITSAVVAIALAFGGYGLVAAVAAIPAMTALHAALGWGWVAAVFGWPRWRAPGQLLRQILLEARHFALSGLLFQVVARIDVVLLAFLLGTAAAGSYNAAYRIVHLGMFVASVASLALLPLASRLHVSSQEAMRSAFGDVIRFALLLAVPAAAGVALVAAPLIDALYGPGFEASARWLRLLALALACSILKSVFEVFLVASDRQRDRVRMQIIAAAVNALALVVMIPLAGVAGAAMVTTLSEGLLAALLGWQLIRLLGRPRLGARAVAAGVGTLAFTLPLAVWPGLPLWLSIAVAVLLYFTVTLVFADVRHAEGASLLRTLRRVLPGSRSLTRSSR